MVLSSISRQKCNILFVNIIYMVMIQSWISLLLYEDYMMDAYVACITVVHFTVVLFPTSVRNDVSKV